jgi:hypothetical protein
MFSFKIDDSRGIVRGTLSGMLTLDDAARFKAEALRQAQSLRAQSGRMLMIMDSRQAETHSTEVNERFRGFTASLVVSDQDRIALVMGSSFRKVRAAELHASPHVKAFISPNAAEIWLLAYVHAAERKHSA